MKKATVLYLLLVSMVAAQPKGSLFIIGGGKISDGLIARFIKLAGGRGAGFLIIPMASAEPEKAVESFSARLKKQGAEKIKALIAQKENADADSNLAKFDGITGIFISGGDQSRLTEIFNGTKALSKIKALYKEGGVIGGTSAGAAVMSGIMLTGNELRNKDSANAYNTLQAGNIETTKGFGLIENAVVDQHFVKRKRMNRLISVVMEHPAVTGIGIDEATAVIITKGKHVEAVGESSVVIFDAASAKSISTGGSGLLSGGNMRLHILKEGDRYNLENHAYTSGKKK